MLSPLLGLVAPRSTEIDAGEPAGPVTVAPVMRRIHRGELEAERRAGGVLANRDGRANRGRNDQAAEPVGANVRLVALGDHLFEARLRAVAVENMIGAVDRGLGRAAAGKQIAVTALSIQQTEHLIEHAGGRFLRRGLAGAVDGKIQLGRRRSNRIADAGDLLEHRLLQADGGADVSDRVVETVDRGQLRAQRDGDAALRAEAGIGGRLLSRSELRLQIVELFVDVERRLDERCKIR